MRCVVFWSAGISNYGDVFIEFLYPLGFLATAGTLVPVLIHLWRKERRNVLRVGSVKLFGSVKRHRINRLRIKNWPLLLLRCFLVVVLSFLLAAPHIDLNRLKSGESGWVLLGAGYAERLDVDQHRLIDSLLDEGYGLRAFEPGFRPIDMEADDTVAYFPDQFGLVDRLDDRLPIGFPVVIFSRPLITQLPGDVPTTTARLTWHAFAQRDTTDVKRWATRAWATATGGIALTIALSDPAETRFEQLIVQGDGGAQGVEMKIEQGRTLVKLTGQPDWVPVDDRRWRVRFVGDGPRPDTDYLRALLAAFQQVTGVPMEVGTYEAGEPCDLLFDLTGRADTVSARTVFRYMPGDPVEQPDNHLMQAGTHTGMETARIHKLIVAEEEGMPVWLDAFGRSLLTKIEKPGQVQFNCYVRFNPQWTDLVWSDAFVSQLVPLLINAEEPLLMGGFHTYPGDERVFAGPIPIPYRATKTSGIGPVPKEANSIPYLAWLALLAFAAERVVTYRYRLKANDGEY